MGRGKAGDTHRKVLGQALTKISRWREPKRDVTDESLHKGRFDFSAKSDSIEHWLAH